MARDFVICGSGPFTQAGTPCIPVSPETRSVRSLGISLDHAHRKAPGPQVQSEHCVDPGYEQQRRVGTDVVRLPLTRGSDSGPLYVQALGYDECLSLMCGGRTGEERSNRLHRSVGRNQTLTGRRWKEPAAYTEARAGEAHRNDAPRPECPRASVPPSKTSPHPNTPHLNQPLERASAALLPLDHAPPPRPQSAREAPPDC